MVAAEVRSEKQDLRHPHCGVRRALCPEAEGVALQRGKENHWMRKSTVVIIGVLACSMLFAVSVAGAATVSAPIADGFAGPLQIAVGQPGGVYVAQDFAGVLTQIGKKGDR